jgi:hypothetical protein
MEILRSAPIPFKIDLAALMKKLRVRAGTPDALELARMAEEAQTLAKPRYVYGQAFVVERGDDFIVIDACRFESRVLRVNLDRAERVFPFVCTCGMEMEEWGNRFDDDMLMSYWAETIKEEVLRAALDAYFAHLSDRYRTQHVSTMSPGSLENWPIGQQQPLFKLLGIPEEVKLTDSMLMVPTKSVSGIVFPTDASFESCQLCPRENCPNRRAPYDETLYEMEYCPSVK